MNTSPPAIRRAGPSARRYTLRPSSPSSLPLKASHQMLGAQSALPDSVDLAMRSFIEPRDQGSEGACSGFSTAAFRELLWATKNGMHLADRLSPAYLYARTRIAEMTWPRDCGGSIADEFAVLQAFGVPPEQDMRFTMDPAEEIPEIADAAAAEYRIGEPCTVDMDNDLAARRVLAAGLPIALGFAVYESFENVGKDGMLFMPDKSREAFLGGHAVLAVGYDTNRRRWKILNSWGKNWGEGGFCFMPWGYPLWEGWTAAAC